MGQLTGAAFDQRVVRPEIGGGEPRNRWFRQSVASASVGVTCGA